MLQVGSSDSGGCAQVDFGLNAIQNVEHVQLPPPGPAEPPHRPAGPAGNTEAAGAPVETGSEMARGVGVDGDPGGLGVTEEARVAYGVNGHRGAGHDAAIGTNDRPADAVALTPQPPGVNDLLADIDFGKGNFESVFFLVEFLAIDSHGGQAGAVGKRVARETGGSNDRPEVFCVFQQTARYMELHVSMGWHAGF